LSRIFKTPLPERRAIIGKVNFTVANVYVSQEKPMLTSCPLLFNKPKHFEYFAFSLSQMQKKSFQK
jgi:hypothetical protein